MMMLMMVMMTMLVMKKSNPYLLIWSSPAWAPPLSGPLPPCRSAGPGAVQGTDIYRCPKEEQDIKLEVSANWFKSSKEGGKI
jgi:hypothetical protein